MSLLRTAAIVLTCTILNAPDGSSDSASTILSSIPGIYLADARRGMTHTPKPKVPKVTTKPKTTTTVKGGSSGPTNSKGQATTTVGGPKPTTGTNSKGQTTTTIGGSTPTTGTNSKGQTTSTVGGDTGVSRTTPDRTPDRNTSNTNADGTRKKTVNDKGEEVTIDRDGNQILYDPKTGITQKRDPDGFQLDEKGNRIPPSGTEMRPDGRAVKKESSKMQMFSAVSMVAGILPMFMYMSGPIRDTPPVLEVADYSEHIATSQEGLDESFYDSPMASMTKISDNFGGIYCDFNYPDFLYVAASDLYVDTFDYSVYTTAGDNLGFVADLVPQSVLDELDAMGVDIGGGSDGGADAAGRSVDVGGTMGAGLKGLGGLGEPEDVYSNPYASTSSYGSSSYGSTSLYDNPYSSNSSYGANPYDTGYGSPQSTSVLGDGGLDDFMGY